MAAHQRLQDGTPCNKPRLTLFSVSITSRLKFAAPIRFAMLMTSSFSCSCSKATHAQLSGHAATYAET
jgi:hypothetical protein